MRRMGNSATGILKKVHVPGDKRVLLVIAAVLAAVAMTWMIFFHTTIQIVPVTERQPEIRYDLQETLGIGRTFQPIAVAAGTFTPTTRLFGRLYHVHGRRSELRDCITVTRSANRLAQPYWLRMQVTWALGNKQGVGSRVTNLFCAGGTGGGGALNDAPNNVSNITGRTLMPAQISTLGGERVIYAEGDPEPVITEMMGIDAFVKNNSGNYLVVTMQLVD